ncbi:hypothetical protein EDD21DRAFT_420903, partial [Dissophora ornata]
MIDPLGSPPPAPVVLKVKDIVAEDPDYHPHLIITRFKTDTNPPPALPYKETMPPAKFCDFWANERHACQWEHSPTRHNSSWFKTGCTREELEALLPDKLQAQLDGLSRPGPQIAYDWSVLFLCRRHRQTRVLPTKRESVGRDCQAQIRIRKLVGQDKIEIEYHWKHSHDDSIQVWSYLPLLWVNQQVKSGHKWTSIQSMLRPDPELMTQLETDDTLIMPSSLLIVQDEVRYALFKDRVIRYLMDEDVVKSVKSWFKKIEEEGGKTMFNADVYSTGFAYGWCTSFQLKLMAENKKIYCMDSTHKTIKDIVPIEEGNK